VDGGFPSTKGRSATLLPRPLMRTRIARQIVLFQPQPSPAKTKTAACGKPGSPTSRQIRFGGKCPRSSRTARPRTARPRTARPRTARPRTARPRTPARGPPPADRPPADRPPAVRCVRGRSTADRQTGQIRASRTGWHGDLSATRQKAHLLPERLSGHDRGGTWAAVQTAGSSEPSGSRVNRPALE